MTEPVSKVGSARKGGRPKGLPKTGGRVAGTPNKVTAPLREVAREYTQDAILTLAEIMRDTEQPGPARVSAANALLDRGYGKPSTVIGDEDGNPAELVHRIILEGVSANG